MNIGQRVKAARKHAKLTQAQLGAKAGMDQTTISKLEKGHNVKTAFMVSIALACEVNPIWLETGKGDMLDTTSGPNTRTEALQLYETKRVYDKSMARVPLLEWKSVTAWIAGAIVSTTPQKEEVFMPCPEPIGPKGFALLVTADTMTNPYPGGESYPSGVIIYVDPSIKPLPGDPVLIETPNTPEPIFRIYMEDGGKKYLKPLNTQYPIQELTHEMKICGVITGSYKSRK
ncbi:helix-turn-helix domain-containing protein [Pseudomonas protegens]|nr:helix-turn-helix domain-containing protein [Pseudomonas protegens]